MDWNKQLKRIKRRSLLMKAGRIKPKQKVNEMKKTKKFTDHVVKGVTKGTKLLFPKLKTFESTMFPKKHINKLMKKK